MNPETVFKLLKMLLKSYAKIPDEFMDHEEMRAIITYTYLDWEAKGKPPETEWKWAWRAFNEYIKEYPPPRWPIKIDSTNVVTYENNMLPSGPSIQELAALIHTELGITMTNIAILLGKNKATISKWISKLPYKPTLEDFTED